MAEEIRDLIEKLTKRESGLLRTRPGQSKRRRSSGQVIPPHPEPYAVVFVVLQGEGIITAGSVEHPVKPLHLSSVKKDENRGICCIQQMALLGIREDV